MKILSVFIISFMQRYKKRGFIKNPLDYFDRFCAKNTLKKEVQFIFSQTSIKKELCLPSHQKVFRGVLKC